MNQIFKKEIPNSLLFNLLDNICLKTERFYYIDYNSYKKFIYEDAHVYFIENLRNYYHDSKKYYLDRTMSYNSFTNMIRQICKHNNIIFNSKIIYNKSKYNIDYFIYLPST
jgi:hypothetical protein